MAGSSARWRGRRTLSARDRIRRAQGNFLDNGSCRQTRALGLAVYQLPRLRTLEGEPSERVVLADTRLIYDYAAARPDVDTANIVVLGRSLGTYFTVALASSRALRGAILATPFDSIAAVGEERYPWLPAGLILNGRYDAAALAPKIKVPALFVLAENDDVTPVENGAALARAWGGPQKILTLAGARHYGIERRPEFWSAVTDFLSAIEPAASRRDDYAGQLVTKP